jgi:nitroreductase
MKIVKHGSGDNYFEEDPFYFKRIRNLNGFDVETTYVEGKSPEYQSDMDKLIMVVEGNIQFKVDKQKTKMNAGDLIHIQCGESFNFDAGTGAKLMQINPELTANKQQKLMEFACTRKSTREFSDKSVLKKDIYYILKIGMHAPSGANRQPWKFIVISDPETKRKIREGAERVEEKYYKKIKDTSLLEDIKDLGLSWKKPFLEHAPYLICVFGNPEQPFYKESLWLTTGWMILAAEELGLASLTYTPSNMRFLSEILTVKKPFQPELIIPIGYSINGEPLQPRKDLREVVSWIE